MDHRPREPFADLHPPPGCASDRSQPAAGYQVVRMPLRSTPRPFPADELELPRHVQIEPVGQCNLRCAMCPIELRPESEPGRAPAHISVGVFKRLIDQFGAIDELHLQGLGEPLLHPHFFDLVAYAAGRGIKVSTNTNLTLMTEARAAACVRSGLHDLHVSLDGASAQAFESIRRRASFDKVLRNLRRVIGARRAASASLPHVHLVAVAMRRNLGELAGLVRLACAEGAESLSVQHLCHDFGESTLPARYRSMRSFIKAESLLDEDPDRIAKSFREARAEAQRLGLPLRLPDVTPHRHADDLPGRKRCDAPWRSAYVSYDGQAMPCCMVATPDRASFGDMALEGVEPVWNSAGFHAFRRALASEAPPDICRGCAVYQGTF